jgi:hypothetical protein
MRSRVAAVAVVAACALAPAALASWASSVSVGGMSISTATLVDPTGLNPSNGTGCRRFRANSLRVDLSWTPTTSTRATGYVVLRNGTQVASVGGASSGGWSDRTGDLAFSTTYTYVVKATVGNWTSGGTTVSIRTLSSRCR